MSVNEVRGSGSNFLPAGRISISRDGRTLKIEDMTIADGLKVDELEMSVSSIGQLVDKLNRGDVDLDISGALSDSRMSISRFKVTLSQGYVDKVARKMSSQMKGLEISEAEIRPGGIEVSGKLKVPMPLMPSVPFSVQLRPEEPADGDLKFRIARASVMLLPLPSFLVSLGTVFLQALGLSDGKVKLKGDELRIDVKGLKFTGLRVDEGRITVEGQVVRSDDVQGNGG